MKLLEIQSSVRLEKSVSRALSIATGKKEIAIVPSAGNFVVGTPLEEMNFCEPYLRSIYSIFSFEWGGNRIRSIFAVVNPEKLGAVKIKLLRSLVN